jgi:hypothetical protein
VAFSGKGGEDTAIGWNARIIEDVTDSETVIVGELVLILLGIQSPFSRE